MGELLKRRRLALSDLADLERAAAGTEANTVSIEDTMNALVELAEMIAEQDDAIVELAGMMEV